MGTLNGDGNAPGKASTAASWWADFAAQQLVAPAENRSPPVNMRLLTRKDERESLDGNWYGVEQHGKLRPCDDARSSSHNLTTALHERLVLESADSQTV